VWLIILKLKYFQLGFHSAKIHSWFSAHQVFLRAAVEIPQRKLGQFVEQSSSRGPSQIFHVHQED